MVPLNLPFADDTLGYEQFREPQVTLWPNRVLGRYVDVALAWGVISRSNGIPYPDAIKHLFTVPL